MITAGQKKRRFFIFCTAALSAGVAIFFVIGVFFAFLSLFQAVSHKNRFNRSPAIFSFIAAILLLNLPAFLDTLAMTIFNTSSEQELSYSPPDSPGSVYIEFAVYAIMLIGMLGVKRCSPKIGQA